MFEKIIEREETIGANQGQDLVRSDQKGDRVDNAQQPENDEASEPIAFPIGKEALPMLEFQDRAT